MNIFGWTIMRTDTLEAEKKANPEDSDPRAPYFEACMVAVMKVITKRFGDFQREYWSRPVGKEVPEGLGFVSRDECSLKLLRKVLDDDLHHHPTLGAHFRQVIVTEELVDFVRKPPFTLIDTTQLIAALALSAGNPTPMV